MYEYDLYVPLSFNDGRSVPTSVIDDTKKRLLDEFGGITDFRHRNLGLWRMGGVTYRDEIIVLRVLANNQQQGRTVFAALKAQLQEKLAQEDVLIVEREVAVL